MHSQSAGLGALLQQRLLRGEHLTLYGPRGSGKSTVLAQLHARLERTGIPCAYSPATTALDDITRALERAYPGVRTGEVGRRAARVRLWNAADRRPGILLLDHFRCNGSAMVSCLRRLHGKVAGVLTAVDVEAETERSRMRSSRYGAMPVRMPLSTVRQLRRLLDVHWDALELPPLEGDAARTFVTAARGRPGWIVQCAQLACERRYWRDCGPLVTVLCLDTEAAVRYQALAMVRAPQPAGEGAVRDFRPRPAGRLRRD
jgi:hypothetical protein